MNGTYNLSRMLVPFVLLLSSCPLSVKPSMVTQPQAIEIAKKEFEKHGRAVSDYDMTVTHDDPSRTYWLICFEKKGPFHVPGGRHCVRVDKPTGASTFMQGE